MSEKSEGVKLIETMPRREFHHKILRGVGFMSEFGGLVSFGTKGLSAGEKQKVWDALAAAGIPLELTESDDDLEDIAAAIAGRSVTLK